MNAPPASPSPTAAEGRLSRSQIADRLAEMADLLEVQEADRLRVRAYRQGADTVREFEARDTEIPVVRDHYYGGYIRQEHNFGLIGIYEDRNAETVWTEGCP